MSNPLRRATRFVLTLWVKHLTRPSRNRQEPRVGTPGFEQIDFESSDYVRLCGWTYRAAGRDCSYGTVIFAHGFACNSSVHIGEATALSATFGLTALSFDHRMHGLSGDAVPTFGVQEALDVQSAMDYADRKGLPKPYILNGVSLGGIAAQLAGIRDTRVRGLFLVACPGSPLHAMGPLGALVNYCHGRDVLRDGDIRRIRQPDGHDPFVCYVIGTRDHYGIEATRESYSHWRGVGAEGLFPSGTPDARKWFWAVPNAVHPGSNGQQIWEWDGFARLRWEFYSRLLASADRA